MKVKDIRLMSRADLDARLAEAEESMGELRYKQGMSQLDNPLRIRKLRRDIARLRTIVHELDLKGTQA
ncbi:MAG: 50S ribosomal protein L29 [bacterium]|jgi:large subunit ribosomal protein L29|nr:50S ribosomal protein L29 [bacterium]